MTTRPLPATDLHAIRAILREAGSPLTLGARVITDDGAAASVALLYPGDGECCAVIGHHGATYHAMDATGRVLGEGQLGHVMQAAILATAA